MAQLKDTVVNGNIRVTDAVLTTTAQVNTIQAPTASNGTTYGPGTDGQVLKSNGSSVYWATDDAGTDAKVAQTATAIDASYELLLSGSADNITRTEGVRKTSTLTYNPSTKALVTGGTINGYTLGQASAKNIDLAITAATTSTKLPTSQAVASFVEGKGYTTNIGTVTGVKVNGTTKSPTSGVVDIGTVITSHQDISGKADKADTILDTTLSRGRKENTTVGEASFAFGYNVTASGNYSHGENSSTTASGNHSHAEGINTTASGYGSHAEGTSTRASGSYAHSQGNSTIAQRKSQHAGGEYNVADTEGTTGTRGTFAEIIGNGSADNARSNARALDWDGNEYLGGDLYVNCGSDSTNGTKVSTTSDLANKADKSDTVLNTTLSRGRKASTTIGTGSLAFGNDATASGNYSHAEGYSTTASGSRSHAEGWSTTASGDSSHAEGLNTEASGSYTHASGCNNVPNSDLSIDDWVADTSYEVGDKVVNQGHIFICTTANSDSTFNPENWTLRDIKKYAEIIGNGLIGTPSNARTLDWEGNEYLNGNLYLNCNEDSSGGVPAVKYIQLLTSDNTWEQVWNKINILAVNETAFIYVPGGGSALPLAILTGGVFQSYYHYGIISKTSEGNFRFSLTSTIQNLLRFSLTGASSSSIGTFTYLRSDYELDAKVDKIVLTSNDDTWDKVWAKISKLSSGDTAGFYANGVAYSVLSGGARSSQCMGIIARYSSGAFQLLLRFTNVYGIYASIVDASSSTRGTYAEGILGTTYNNLDRTTSGYALDARQGKVLNDKIMPDTQIYQSSSTSHAFTVPTNSRNLFIMGGDGVTYAYIAYIYGSSNGTVTCHEIYKGSKIGTVTFATNKITIPLTTASSVYCRSITVRGNPISN